MKLCECGCGKPTHIYKATNVRWGQVKGQPARFLPGHNAVGKGNGRFIDGHRKRPEYAAYVNARGRCTNPKDGAFKDYGARGIQFLFTSFEQWFAEIGPRPATRHTVDRIINSGHYTPGNIRWATRHEQGLNRRKYAAIENFTNAELLQECKRRGI